MIFLAFQLMITPLLLLALLGIRNERVKQERLLKRAIERLTIRYY